jgi:hypothetical protein
MAAARIANLNSFSWCEGMNSSKLQWIGLAAWLFVVAAGIAACAGSVEAPRSASESTSAAAAPAAQAEQAH